mgnify:CR=1 FL=1
MGILADIFIATPVDALKYESLVNDRPALIERYQPAEHRNLTGLEFGSLWAILVNEAWDYDEHKLIEVRFGEGGETWLLKFPGKPVNLLAAIRDDELQSIADRWSQTEELVMRGGDDTEKLLGDLRRLATESKKSGAKMYLWGSL